MEEDEIMSEIHRGRLAHVMHKIPLEVWKEPSNKYMWAAIRVRGNEKAVGYLISQGASLLGVQTTILHCILELSMYEMICANAKSLSLFTNMQDAGPLHSKMRHGYEFHARLLVKYGARIKDYSVATEMIIAFQNAVLHCRKATIAMIQLKKYLNVDKFLLIYMARFIWATREDDMWYSANDMDAMRGIESHKRQIERLREKSAKIGNDIFDREKKIARCRNAMIKNK